LHSVDATAQQFVKGYYILKAGTKAGGQGGKDEYVTTRGTVDPAQAPAALDR
jgi:hypothetical protein